MKKENVQFYEAPEVEAIEVRMERSIVDGSCASHQEETCITEHQLECPDDFDE